MNLAELLRAWLRSGGGDGQTYDQAQICERSGLTAAQLSAIYTGKNVNPRWHTVQRIAAGLKLTELAFFVGPEKKVIAVEQNAADVLGNAPPKVDAGRAHTVMVTPPYGPGAPVPQPPRRDPQLAAAIEALEHATAAFNTVTARSVLADARRKTAAPRATGAKGRPRARKHRR